MEDQAGGYERQGNGNDADQCCPPLEKEEEQQHDNENAAENQRIGEIMKRSFDEGRWPEDLRIDLDPLKARSHFLERGFYAMRDFECVGPGKFLHDQQDTGPVIDYRVADQRLMVLDDPGYVG